MDLNDVVRTFKNSQALASLLLVKPTASFDLVQVNDGGQVEGVSALAQSEVWVNGGFFVMRKEIFRHLGPGEELVREPFQGLINDKALLAYRYSGFWQCMDTFKDKQALEELNQGAAPWKLWLVRNGSRE